MKTTASLFLSAILATTLVAQDDAQKGAPKTPPNPKHAEHDDLKPLAGTWEITMRNEPMPGVPGMETAGECKGTEHAELLANGLWLRSTIDATQNGKPMQMLWLVGYDPFQKKYTGACVCSDEQNPQLATMTGTHDKAKKTWTFQGKTAHGDMRSVMVVESPDSITETCYMTGPDGKEIKCMEITRKRSAAAATSRATDASAKTSAKLPAEIAAMQKDIGEWEATVKCSMPGMPATEDKGTEKVVAISGGRWLWSDFNGQFAGQPFQGHSLTGYDPIEKKIVSIWIDSMTPVWCKTTGAPAASGEIKLEGSCVDPFGKPMTVKQTLKHTDDATRSLQMETNCSQGNSKMDITYRRKS
jgi:hypothetical protein